MKSFLVFITVLGTVTAYPLRNLQNVIIPTPTDFIATFYSNPSCQETFNVTKILGQTTFCQRPGGGSNFKVTCTGNTGVVQFCNDNNCGNCPVSTAFTSDQCLSNPDVNAASVSFTCLTTSNNPIITQPVCGRCSLTYYEFPGCNGPDRTSLDLVSGACQTGTSGSYLVKAFDDNSGGAAVTFCSDQSCLENCITTPFEPNQCRENDPSTGSLSISAVCGVCVSPTPSPIPSSSSTPTATSTSTASVSASASSIPSSTSTASAIPSSTASAIPSSTSTATASAIPSASSTPAYDTYAPTAPNQYGNPAYPSSEQSTYASPNDDHYSTDSWNEYMDDRPWYWKWIN